MSSHGTCSFAKEWNALVSHFEKHTHSTTSIKVFINPRLSVSCGDNQLTIWDLSLEEDEEEKAEFKAYTKKQLNKLKRLKLFFHQLFLKKIRDKDLKELHRQNQIPGMIISTDSYGFNSFDALQHVEHPS